MIKCTIFVYRKSELKIIYMKKIVFALLIFSAFTGIVSAQFFSFGIKGGLNYSKLSFDNTNVTSGSNTYSLKEDESFQGFHVGLMTRIKVFNVFVQPELLFNTSGGKVLIGSTTGTEVRQIKYNKIDLPVLVGMKFGPLRVNAGPVASAVLSSDSKLEEIIPDLKSESKKATIGLQAGVGLDILKIITFDARYEGGLSRLGDKLTVSGTDYAFDSRSSKWLISLGFFF